MLRRMAVKLPGVTTAACRPPLLGDAWEECGNAQWRSFTKYAYERATELLSVYPDTTGEGLVKLLGVDFEEALEMTVS